MDVSLRAGLEERDLHGHLRFGGLLNGGVIDDAGEVPVDVLVAQFELERRQEHSEDDLCRKTARSATLPDHRDRISHVLISSWENLKPLFIGVGVSHSSN